MIVVGPVRPSPPVHSSEIYRLSTRRCGQKPAKTVTIRAVGDVTPDEPHSDRILFILLGGPLSWIPDGPSVLVLDGDYDTSLVIAGVDRGSRRNGGWNGDDATQPASSVDVLRLRRGRPPSDDPAYADAVAGVIRSARPTWSCRSATNRWRASTGSGRRSPRTSRCVSRRRTRSGPPSTRRRRSNRSQLGIETPVDYSRRVADLAADGRPDVSDHLPFPVFLKARRENGSATTSPVSDPEAFWESYDRIAAAAPRGDVLVQEYVDGSDSTYGCGVLCFDNAVELTCVHEEVRSVPRHGGSGTHLRLESEESVARDATRLLTTIGWDGVALVEFKRRADGTFVLMEINPKFWASYALASRFGYRFASTIVADRLDLAVETPVGSPAERGEMVFPLRELQFQLENRRGLPAEYAATVCRRTAAWDVDHRDLGAWLVPPVSLLAKLPTIDVSSPTSDTVSTVRDERKGRGVSRFSSLPRLGRSADHDSGGERVDSGSLETLESDPYYWLCRDALRYASEREYTGWDYADGLSSALVRSLPFEHRYLNLAVQETIKRAPVNLRPLFLVGQRRNYKGGPVRPREPRTLRADRRSRVRRRRRGTTRVAARRVERLVFGLRRWRPPPPTAGPLECDRLDAGKSPGSYRRRTPFGRSCEADVLAEPGTPTSHGPPARSSSVTSSTPTSTRARGSTTPPRGTAQRAGRVVYVECERDRGPPLARVGGPLRRSAIARGGDGDPRLRREHADGRRRLDVHRSAHRLSPVDGQLPQRVHPRVVPALP